MSSDLHQSEFGERQYAVACAVLLHVFHHPFVQLLPVFRQRHIDEVHYDDAAHVAQPQLACQLIGCAQVDVDGVHLLALGRFGTISAVDVDNV